MPVINTAVQLANIRSEIDAQQQIIALLESQLQQAILGDVNGVTVNTLFNAPGGIADIYNGLQDGAVLTDAMFDGVDSQFDVNDELDQTALRQMLYQARALLGELRVEEQQWNQEVTQEKERRKEISEFAKA